jgi:hypothetical protein
MKPGNRAAREKLTATGLGLTLEVEALDLPVEDHPAR